MLYAKCIKILKTAKKKKDRIERTKLKKQETYQWLPGGWQDRVTKQHMENIRSVMELFCTCGSEYTTICQNIQNFTPKRVNFTACKLLLKMKNVKGLKTTCKHN